MFNSSNLFRSGVACFALMLIIASNFSFIGIVGTIGLAAFVLAGAQWVNENDD